MLALHLVPLVSQVLVPIVLLAWHGVSADRHGAGVVLRTTALAAYFIAIGLAGLWLVVPVFLWIVYLIILGVQSRSVHTRLRSIPRWPPNRGGWMDIAVSVVLLIASAPLIAVALQGRRPALDTIVDLEFPLRDGTYYVANGGSHAIVSAHVQTLTTERMRDYRGQSYGVDVVKVNRWGVRASGFGPRDPRRYAIFGDSIYAPCPGIVLRAEDGRPDMPPPDSDRSRLAGNYVFLKCGDVHVLLGHMERGSVRVQPGDHVTPDDIVGRVGNSGNTNEPHLHIHAQRPATGDAYLSGDPLPMRLNGRFLVRNDRIRRVTR
jgi:hypothetical protein